MRETACVLAPGSVLPFGFPLGHVEGLRVLVLGVSSSSCPKLSNDLGAGNLWHSTSLCPKAETLCSSSRN